MRIVLSALLCAALAGQLIRAWETWDVYKDKFHKYYESEEDANRRENYFRTMATVDVLKKSNGWFEMGPNYMSDWSPAEVHRLLSPVKPFGPSSSASTDKFYERPRNTTYPAEFDWVYSLRPQVSPVRRQIKCGSGWAMAATGLLEGLQRQFNSTARLYPLSEHHILDCQTVGGKWVYDDPCEGGSIAYALDNIKKLGGIHAASDYVHRPDKLCQDNKKKFRVQIESYKEMSFVGQEAWLKHVIARKHGPVAALMTVPTHFEYYKRDTITSAHCNSLAAPNHAVLIVGYDRQGNYIVKNSWGADWGQGGYFKIKGNNTCKILEHVYLAHKKK